MVDVDFTEGRHHETYMGALWILEREDTARHKLAQRDFWREKTTQNINLVFADFGDGQDSHASILGLI